MNPIEMPSQMRYSKSEAMTVLRGLAMRAGKFTATRLLVCFAASFSTPKGDESSQNKFSGTAAGSKIRLVP
jgi:hypothetical protein